MEDEPDHEPVFARTRYQRTSTGLEFDRFANFADAIYAISMTFVVVGIAVPTLTDDTQQPRAARSSCTTCGRTS